MLNKMTWTDSNGLVAWIVLGNVRDRSMVVSAKADEISAATSALSPSAISGRNLRRYCRATHQKGWLAELLGRCAAVPPRSVPAAIMHLVPVMGFMAREPEP